MQVAHVCEQEDKQVTFLYLVEHLGAEEVRSLVCGRVRSFGDILGQTVWFGGLLEHHVGTVHAQVVDIQGCEVIYGAKDTELVGASCLVNKVVKCAWQQHLFKCYNRLTKGVRKTRSCRAICRGCDVQQL